MKILGSRWWIFGSLPFGILVGWQSSRIVPPAIAALFVVASTLIGCVFIRWRVRVLQRQAWNELVNRLYPMPEYLTERMWARAEAEGLISRESLDEIRRLEAAERVAARRAKKESDDA